MSWLDDPRAYYALVDGSVGLSQGDILAAPTALLFQGNGCRELIIDPPSLGDARTIRLWTNAGNESILAAPTLAVEVTWSLAMVVPHKCAMEKEWNERVSELLVSGHSQKEAETRATEDPNLDTKILIAPFRRYEGLTDRHIRSIRSGDRLGAFPVIATNSIPEGYIDLNALTAAHYTLVLVEQRIASLSNLAISYLQRALAMHFAYRHDSAFDEIAKAVGRTIVKTSVIEYPSKKSRRIKIALILDDGNQLILEGKGDVSSEDGSYAPVRPPRTMQDASPS